MRLALLATLLLVGLALWAPPASSAANPVPPGCGTSARDTNGDGVPDPDSACSTPRCGCACPVVGAGVDVWVAGQEYHAAAATSGCQTAYAAHGTSGTPDPMGPTTVDPYTICWSYQPIPCHLAAP